MPLGILSDEDFDKELGISEKKDEVTARVEQINQGGRKSHSTTVPPSLKKIIGGTAIEDGGRQTYNELAKPFGLSYDVIEAYRTGRHSNQGRQEKKEDLVDHLTKVRQGLAIKATDKLDRAIESITNEKLAAAKARDLAGIAKDMSVVVRNIEGERGNGITNNQFVIYAPHVMNEDRFETIIAQDARE